MNSVSTGKQPELDDAQPAQIRAGLAEQLVASGRIARGDLDRVERQSLSQNVDFETAVVGLGLISRAELDLVLQQLPGMGAGVLASSVANELVCLKDPNHAYATAVYRIRAALVNAHSKSPGPMVVSVVGLKRGEGRTTLAANLAIAFSQMQVRTLLVDGDMRHGRLHQLFGSPTSTGLAQTLGKNAGAEVDKELTTPAGASLALMPSGASTNPQVLLSSIRFKAVVSQLRRQNDVVVIDTPSWNEGVDAQLIAAESDFALVCAQIPEAEDRAMRQMLATLSQHGVRCFGVPAMR